MCTASDEKVGGDLVMAVHSFFRWEIDDGYCQQLLKPTSEYYYGILEFTDSCVFDFLMGNADRHHYETYAKASKHGRLMHIDNGKRLAMHAV